MIAKILSKLSRFRVVNYSERESESDESSRVFALVLGSSERVDERIPSRCDHVACARACA